METIWKRESKEYIEPPQDFHEIEGFETLSRRSSTSSTSSSSKERDSGKPKRKNSFRRFLQKTQRPEQTNFVSQYDSPMQQKTEHVTHYLDIWDYYDKLAGQTLDNQIYTPKKMEVSIYLFICYLLNLLNLFNLFFN